MNNAEVIQKRYDEWKKRKETNMQAIQKQYDMYIARKPLNIESFESDLAAFDQDRLANLNGWDDVPKMQQYSAQIAALTERAKGIQNYFATYGEDTGNTQEELSVIMESLQNTIHNLNEVSKQHEAKSELYKSFNSKEKYDVFAKYYPKYAQMSKEEEAKALLELSERYNTANTNGTDDAAQLKEELDYLYTYGSEETRILRRKEQYRINQTEIERLKKEIDALGGPKQKKAAVEKAIQYALEKYGNAEKVKERTEKITELTEQYEALVAENNRYDRGQGAYDSIYGEMQEILKKPDYAELSKPAKKQWYIKGIQPDTKYEFINYGTGTIFHRKIEKPDVSMAKYQQMTKDEKGVYNYIYATKGGKAAEDFLEKIEGVLNERDAAADEAEQRERIERGGWSAVGANLESIFTKPVGDILSVEENILRPLSGKEMDPNSGGNKIRNINNAIRGYTAQLIEENSDTEFLGKNLWSQVYNAGMSTLDSLYGAATFGKFYTFVAASGAAADKSAELYEKGATGDQIFWGGLSAGIAEYVFEKIPLENLIKPKNPDSVFKVVWEILKQAGIEGLEEIGTEIANTITDSIIMGSQSDLSLAVKEYQEQGLSYEEAYKKALLDKAVDISWAGISGFLSGNMSSTALTGYQGLQNKNVGRNIKSIGGSSALIDFAKQNYGKDTEVYKLAEQLSKKQNVGEMALGALYTAIQQQNQSDFAKAEDVSAKAIQLKLENKGIKSPQAASMAKSMAKDTKGGTLTAKQRQAIMENGAANSVYESVRADVENKKAKVQAKARALIDALNGNAENNMPNQAQNLDNPDRARYTNNIENESDIVAKEVAGAAGNYLELTQPASRIIRQANYSKNGTAVGVNRGDGYARTEEFRELQEASRGMPGEISALYHSGKRTLDGGLRRDISRIFQTQIDAAGNGVGNGDGILTLTAKGNTFRLHQQVNGALFHDVFEIAKGYLKNGELVDLHDIQTTEDGIGYDDCYNYLSDDGLSGFSITPDGDLISVFNASGRGGFLNAIAPLVRESAKTLDCYNSSVQPLMGIYSKVLGFKAASVMDYNMEYDHDNIAANHDNPQVAFMVNTEQEIETKHFAKDQYEEAKAYRDQYVEQAAEKAASFMPAEPVITERSAQAPEADQIVDTVYAVRGEMRLTNDQRIIRRIGACLGWRVEFGDVRTANGMPADGKIDKKNKVITINTANKNPIAFVLKHELAHLGEGSKQYWQLVKKIGQSQQYAKWLRAKIGENTTVERMEAALNAEIRQRYETAGETLSVAEARNEIMADFMGDMLFADAEGMNRLLSELEAPERRGFIQWIKDALAYLKSKLGNADSRLKAELERLEQQYAWMLRESETDARIDNSDKYSLNPNFEAQYDEWDKKCIDFSFFIGNTSNALKSIGIKDRAIRWDASKIVKIKAKHPYMTDAVIKQVPNILENPVLIMESQTNPDRITLFGEVYDAKENPVLAVLELNPTNRQGISMDIIKIASAYGKDTNPQSLIDRSKILYKDADKKRIQSWLNLNRLQLPLDSTNFESKNRISYEIDSVNSNSMQKGKKNTEKANSGTEKSQTNETDIIKVEDGVQYSIAKSYEQQVEDVLNNSYDKNNHVYMGETPSELVRILGFTDLPMLVTNNHIYSMSVSEQQAKQEGRYKKGTHYHDLGDIVKELPKLLNEPVLIIKSNTKADDMTVVVVTSAMDKSGRPIMAAIKPVGKGFYCNVEIDANIMLSGYGRNNMQNYVQTASNEDRILYADKKSNQQHTIPGVQFPNNIMTADYNNSLAQYRQSVNSILFQKAENDTPKIQYSIGYTTENKPVVIIEENILEGVPRKDWVKTVKETIANKFSKGIPVSGRLIKVNQKTRNEYTNSKYSQYLKNTKDKKIIFEDKLQSANNLDEIILASTNYINEDLKHERKDNFKEFARGDVFLRIGENDYSAKVIVGLTEGNQMVLYDVVDFESADFQMKKTGASNSAYLRTVRNDAPVQHIVPQKGTDVNSILFQKAENDTKETQYSISTDSTQKYEEVTEQRRNGEITEEEYIRRIGSCLGWRVEFGDVRTANGMAADGKIDKANRVITISTKNTRPIEFILKHELAHRGEETEQYEELVKTVLRTKQYKNWLREKTGMQSTVEQMEAVLNEEMQRRYGTAGESIFVAEARNEIMADFMGDMLFADAEGMNRLLSELEAPERRGFIQWIKDALAYLKSKLGNADSRLKAELELMESKYAQILRAAEMRQNEGKEQYSFAGIFAKNADNFKLDTAREMEESGEATQEQIRKETGWYRGYDGLWRFEIDDSKMKIKETNIVDGDTKLGDILEHSDLFAAYPQLKDITICAQPAFLKNDVDGWYSEETKEIVLNSKYLENAAVKHEIEVLKNTEAYQQYQEDLKKAAKKKDSKRVNLVLKFGRLQHTPAYQDYIKRRTEAKNANDVELCNQIEFEWQTSKTGMEYQKLKNQFYELSNDTALEEITKEFYKTETGIRYLQLLRNIENADIVNNKETRKALMHEMQHAIQYIEGFANGSSPDFWKSHKNTMTEPEQRLYRKAGLEVKQLYEKLQEQFGFEAVDTTNESIMLENRLRTENLTKKELSRIVERIEEIHGTAEQKGYRTLQRETEKAAEELKAVEESIEARKKRTSEELYLSTAGEIEARDVVRRLELSAIERKQLRPDIDRTDVVFAEEGLENEGIKVEGQGNLDIKEAEGYNESIDSEEPEEHLRESSPQLSETFYQELEQALSAENRENESVKNDREIIISTLGKEIDITPYFNHISVNKNPGPFAEQPNSSIDIIDANGNIKTRRWYDSDKKAYKDVDFSDHGNSKEHLEVPHEHMWEYNNGKPKRN